MYKGQNIIENNNTYSRERNSILQNTYLLLSMTIIFSSIMSLLSAFFSIKPMNPLINLISCLVIISLLNKNKDNAQGIFYCFLFTGFLGWTLGPILNFYLRILNNGSEILIISLISTGLSVLGLSIIGSLNKDYSRMQSFIFTGSLVCISAVFVNLFIRINFLFLSLSIMTSLISGCLLIIQTNKVIYGGESNYIVATTNIYMSIFNLFSNILYFSSVFLGERE